MITPPSRCLRQRATSPIRFAKRGGIGCTNTSGGEPDLSARGRNRAAGLAPGRCGDGRMRTARAPVPLRARARPCPRPADDAAGLAASASPRGSSCRASGEPFTAAPQRTLDPGGEGLAPVGRTGMDRKHPVWRHPMSEGIGRGRPSWESRPRRKLRRPREGGKAGRPTWLPVPEAPVRELASR